MLPLPDVTEIPGPACYCGKHGCLERWVSGRAFAQDYLRHAQVDLAEPTTVTAREVMSRVRAGDRLAGLVWDRYLDRLARGLATVVNTLDPDVLVIGGGMSDIPELYAELPGRLARTIFSPCFYTPILRRRTATSAESVVRPCSGRTTMHDDEQQRFAFATDLIAEAGAVALEYFGRVSSLAVNSTGSAGCGDRGRRRGGELDQGSAGGPVSE